MGSIGRTTRALAAALGIALGGCDEGGGVDEDVQVVGDRPGDGGTSGSTDGGASGGDTAADGAGGTDTGGTGGGGDAPLARPLASSFEALFGDVEFVYGFDGTAERLVHRTRFEPSDVRTINGDELLIAIDDDTSPTCDVLFLTGEPRYLCNVLEVDADAPAAPSPSTAFLFALGADGRGRGVFEYCPVGVEPETCGAELAVTPDGSVTVSVGVAAKGARRSDVELVHGDPAPYLLVGEQTQAAPSVTPAPGGAARALVDRLSRLREGGRRAITPR